MPTILVVLQNAWCAPDKPLWKNELEWESRLWASHTGRRLVRMLPKNAQCIPVNSSREVGTTLQETFEPDIEWLRFCYQFHRPDLVVGFGKIAQAGLIQAHIPHVPAPHPAWRQLSIPMEKRVRRLLIRNLQG